MEGFVAGAWRQFRRAEVFVGSQWRRVTRVEGYIGGQWRTVATFVSPLSVSISPPDAYGFANPFKPSTQTITTGTVVATPSGGLGPYTYLWSTGNTPTLASNSFTRTVPPNSSVTIPFSVTVTDSQGTPASAAGTATFENEAQSG